MLNLTNISMDNRKTKKKDSCVALDIGTRLVKAIEVTSEGGAVKLVKLHCAEIALPTTEETTKTAIKSLLENFHPSLKDINISLSFPHAIVRFINMPKMKEEDLKKSLQFEAEKYIPFKVSEVVTDAAILGDLEEDKKQMRVVFAAVKRKAVDSRLAMLKAFGLSPPLIDIDSFACFNAFCNSSGDLDDSKSIALLNIGYTHTSLIISEGKNPFFSRDIQIGAKDMSKGISQKMQVKENESDKLIFDKDKGAEVYEAAKTALSALIDELRLSFGYYENQHGKSISEIYVSGGAARLSGILKYFEEAFGVKTAPWDPFSKFEINLKTGANALEAIRSQFAVCAGLVLR